MFFFTLEETALFDKKIFSDEKNAVAQEENFFRKLKEESIMAASITGQGTIARAANYINSYTNKTAANVTRLSGNTRFASGADNPAGMAFAQRIRAKSLGVEAAAENMQNSQTVAKIAESAYSSILDILTKARETASQATNPEYSNTDAASAGNAVKTLYSQVTNIEKLATFNGKKVLTESLAFEAGGDATVSISVGSFGASGVTAPSITTPATAETAAGLGYVADFVNNKASIYQEASDNANNVNIPTETAAYVRNTIATQAGQYILAQQNQNAYSVLNLLK